MLGEYDQEIAPPVKNAKYWHRHHRTKLQALADRISADQGIIDYEEREAVRRRVSSAIIKLSEKSPDTPGLELMREYESAHRPRVAN